MPWATDSRLIQSLLSSSCWIVGQLETTDLCLQIAFPMNQRDRSNAGKAFVRGHFLLSVRIPDDATQSFAVPSMTVGEETVYYWPVVGERLTDLAAIWFGKRFDYHGLVANGKLAFLPNLISISPITVSELEPYDGTIRPDLGIELNLGQLQTILKFLYMREPRDKINAFWTALHFYASALRVFEIDSEMAFLHFVVALETISSQICIQDNDLYDEQTRCDLKDIEKLVNPQAANRIKERLYQVKRRVVYTVKHLLKEAFFEGSKAEGVFKLNPDRVEKCMKAVYDLRSEYLHGGAPFAAWFTFPTGGPTAEVNIGRPVLPGRQRELENILANIPTFVGLERIVRFTILSFAHNYIDPIHPRLQ